MAMITVTLLHPTMEDRKLTLELPRETKFSQLTDMLYERDFVQPQKPGYAIFTRTISAVWLTSWGITSPRPRPSSS